MYQKEEEELRKLLAQRPHNIRSFKCAIQDFERVYNKLVKEDIQDCSNWLLSFTCLMMTNKAGLLQEITRYGHLFWYLNVEKLYPELFDDNFIVNIASNVAKQGHAVAIFSLEMSREQLITRMLSSDALIQGSQLRSGNLSVDDWTKLALSAQTIAKMPMYIDDTAGITVAEMKAKLRRIRNLGLVIIDYLQLMSSGRRIDNRVQEVSEITRNLKVMAKELDVPIITLSQLSRSPDKRTGDHRPVLSDLRESGSIEQDAYEVVFLYRDDYYNPDTEEKNVAECIVAKNRHGETGTVKLQWLPQYTTFSDREGKHSEP